MRFVVQIIVEDGRATGVEVSKDGHEFQVKARNEVILSAGTIESPRILMLSGIGPKQHLTKLGIPVHLDLPVGNNLQDHPMCVTEYLLTNPPTSDLSEQRKGIQRYVLIKIDTTHARKLVPETCTQCT